MAWFYTINPVAFYNDILKTDIPAEAKNISDAEHAVFMEGQSSGKLLKTNAAGQLYLEDYVAPNTTNHLISYIAFFNRFTAQEQHNILTEAQKNPMMLSWLLQAAGAGTIDLQGTLTKSGLQYLSSNGLLATNRITELLKF